MFVSLRYLGPLVLAAPLLLAGCDSTEPGGNHGHTPEAVQLVVGEEIIEEGGTMTVPAGETVRVEVQFLDAEGEVITGIEEDHHTRLTFTPSALGTTADVEGRNFQKDVTFQGGPGTGTVTAGYGHDPEANELTFGPFNVTVVAAGA